MASENRKVPAAASQAGVRPETSVPTEMKSHSRITNSSERPNLDDLENEKYEWRHPELGAWRINIGVWTERPYSMKAGVPNTLHRARVKGRGVYFAEGKLRMGLCGFVLWSLEPAELIEWLISDPDRQTNDRNWAGGAPTKLIVPVRESKRQLCVCESTAAQVNK